MYTIQLKDQKTNPLVLVRRLQKFFDKSRFKAQFNLIEPTLIYVKPIRLKEAKPYCGQHPGECQLGATRKARYLEWEDWVEFNNLVNNVLDGGSVKADVFSKPPERLDKGTKFWIRRGSQGRKRYDWEQSFESRGGGLLTRPVRVWNHGTEDQFS